MEIIELKSLMKYWGVKMSKIKVQFKGFVIGTVTASVLIFSFSAYAMDVNKTIKVLFNAVSVKIDNKIVGGDKLNYNGKVFIEAKSIAQLLNKSYNTDKGGNVDIKNKQNTTPTPTPIVPSTNKEPLVFDDFKANLDGIDMKSNYDEVIIKLGKPISENQNDGGYKTLYYADMQVVLSPQKIVCSIKIFNTDVKLKSGLMIGDSVEKLTKIHETSIVVKLMPADVYEYNNNLYFVIINEKIVAYGLTGSW
jgi:hypothetical protein